MRARLEDNNTLSRVESSYYTKEGLLYLRKSSGRRCSRDPVGSVSSEGYLVTKFEGRIWPVHRIVYFLHYRVWPSDNQVDHVNGDKLDNRPINLRLTTCSQNRRGYSPVYGRSVYRGVSWRKDSQSWRAFIKVSVPTPKDFSLGSFQCEKEAALAYNCKAEELGYSKEAFNRVFEDVKVGPDD